MIRQSKPQTKKPIKGKTKRLRIKKDASTKAKTVEEPKKLEPKKNTE